MVKKGRNRSGGAPGERNRLAKLTDARVKLIRSSTLSERDLAKKFGVSQQAIHFAKTRQTWRHVEP